MVESERKCALGYKVFTLTYGDCVSRRILTRHCRGSCNSRHQSILDANSECYNCDVAEVVVKRVSLLCPVLNDRRSFVPKIVDVNVPSKCGCSLCGGYNKNDISSDNKTQAQV